MKRGQTNLAIFLLVPAVIVIPLLAGCGQDEDVPIGTTPYEDMVVAMMLDRSGPGHSYGEASWQSVLMAADDRLHEQPAVSIAAIGPRIDTEGDPARGATFVDSVSLPGETRFVIGPSNSSVAAACASALDAGDDEILLSPSSVAISLEETDNLLRFAPSDRNQAAVVVDSMLAAGVDELMILRRENDTWARDLSDAVVAELLQAGISQLWITDYDPANVQAALADAELTVAGEWEPVEGDEAVYMVSFAEGVEILAAVDEYEHLNSVPWFGASAFAQNADLLADDHALANAAARGLVCPAYGVERTGQAGNVSFRLAQALGREPEAYALVAYDIYLLLDEFARTFDPPADLDPNTGEFHAHVRDELIDLASRRTGITGPLALNEYGDRVHGDYFFWAIEDGDWTVVAEVAIGGGE